MHTAESWSESMFTYLIGVFRYTHDILRFEVKVNYLSAVHIGDAIADLSHKPDTVRLL